MSVIVFALFVPALALAWALSQHQALGILRRSALNPMLVVLLLAGIAAADFTSVAALGYGELGQHIVSANSDKIVELSASHAMMLVAFLLGIAAVFYSPRLWRIERAPPSPVDLRLGLVALYVACLLTWLIMVSSYSANFFSLQGSIEVKINSSSDPILHVASMLLLPALCYALCRQPFKVAVPLVALTVFIVFFSGSRTRVLFALVPFFFYLVMARGAKIPRGWFIIGVIVFGFLSIAALNLRFLISYSRAVSAESTFAFTNPLNTPDIAAAEASVVLDRLRGPRITPFPGENLVGFVVAPLPRSVAPFKPRSGSVQFTMAYDPRRWQETGSALIVGSVNEIDYDYPLPIALILIALFGAGWGLALARAVRSPTIHGFPAVVMLYIFAINFFRGDLFIAGSVLFVFLFYAVIVQWVRGLKLSVRASPRPQQPARAISG